MTPRIIPSFRRDLFGILQPIIPTTQLPEDLTIERWAQAMLDTELEANLAALEAEKGSFFVVNACQFGNDHPECRCEERLPTMHKILAKISAIKLERGLRYGMTAHQKMSRVAAARA